MKKRKMTRMNLVELAKKMSVITDSEKYNGGTVLFSEDAQFTSVVFDGSNEIRVIEDISSWLSGGFLGSISGTYAFVDANSNVASNILTSIASGIGISGTIGVISDPNYNLQAMTSGTTQDLSGQILVNLNGFFIQSGNYYDIQSILYHEKQHSETMGDGGTLQSEFDALQTEMSLSSFALTSPEYQADARRRYEELYDLLY
ncbi:MAG TPA: hypothetical protein PKC47_05300 [Petrimonas sp.]|nr:hypothetical protein [Petrimonas sp.]